MSELDALEVTPEDGRFRPWLGAQLLSIRLPLIAIFAVITAALAWQMSLLKPDASFEKMIPVSHPFIKNFLASKDDLKGLDVLSLAANPAGDISPS